MILLAIRTSEETTRWSKVPSQSFEGRHRMASGRKLWMRRYTLMWFESLRYDS